MSLKIRNIRNKAAGFSKTKDAWMERKKIVEKPKNFVDKHRVIKLEQNAFSDVATS